MPRLATEVPAAAAPAAEAPVAEVEETEPKKSARFYALDGWRAISILLVLSSHMLPLGPRSLELNSAAGQMGMALFFTLSGFLITTQLYKKRHLGTFYIRRLFRIVPLAWLYTAAVVVILGAPVTSALVQAVFATNYAHAYIVEGSEHFWSLCVEVHFYVAIGLLMAITRFRGFRLIPLVWIGVVITRLVLAPQGTIETHLRVDEILAGACLGLVHLGLFGPRPRAALERAPLWSLLLLLGVASHTASGHFGALRSLLAASVVGHTLFHSERGGYAWLGHRALLYVAETSYALYVVHPLTLEGWFNTGGTVVRYAKRVLSFALTFGLAHLSTRYYELPITNLGRRLSKRVEAWGATGASHA